MEYLHVVLQWRSWPSNFTSDLAQNLRRTAGSSVAERNERECGVAH